GLDDGVGERAVASSEWRTAPLMGMAQTPGRRYLHDGRAPTLDLAIRGHGGEADSARSRYLALGEADRDALIEFVGSL
ncbi:MAG: di-heme oxidoredictase family protein, partial [Burkholderiales bacterium]